MTLAEWRAALEGVARREKGDMRKRAWELTHLLIAAGCKAESVTVEKLLGEKEKRSRRPRLTPEEQLKKSAQKAWERVVRDRERKAVKGEVK